MFIVRLFIGWSDVTYILNHHKFVTLIWSVRELTKHKPYGPWFLQVVCGLLQLSQLRALKKWMSKRKQGGEIIAPDSISDVEVCIPQSASPRQQWQRRIGRPWSDPRRRSSLSASSWRAPPSTCSRSSPPTSRPAPFALFFAHNLCKRLMTGVPCN